MGIRLWLFGRPVSVWLWPSLAVVWGKQQEYWTAYRFGPVVVLIGHSQAYWDENEQWKRDDYGEGE